jgi:hypothetical protein
MPTPFEVFKERLVELVGDTLLRHGYVLQDDAIQMSGGLYRFSRTLDGGSVALVDVQLLFYSGGGASRFEVKVWRSDQPAKKTRLGVWLREQSFDTLADESGWWEFVSGRELEEVLQDAAIGVEERMKAEG